MEEDMLALEEKKNGTWDLVNLPNEKKLVVIELLKDIMLN